MRQLADLPGPPSNTFPFLITIYDSVNAIGRRMRVSPDDNTPSHRPPMTAASGH